MRTALLGFPQAGKKTLFSLLTGRDVPPGRKVGEAVEGAAPVRDPRVDKLAELCRPEEVTYAENRFVLCPDVPWQVSSREWLEAARKCDLICLVLRAFESDVVFHPAGSVDARRDREALEGELLLADMAMIETRLSRIDKENKAGRSPERQREEQALRKAMAALEDGVALRDADLDQNERGALCSLELVSVLPLLRVCNVSEDGVDADFGERSVAVSCLIEQELTALDEAAERREFLEALGLDRPGLDRVNAAAYDALGLMSFYTSGEDECRAWTVAKGATAPVAGGKIHSDIQRGFIRVEVIKFDDFVAAGSERKAREDGKVQTRGKDYVIEDGDICHFLFNV